MFKILLFPLSLLIFPVSVLSCPDDYFDHASFSTLVIVHDSDCSYAGTGEWEDKYDMVFDCDSDEFRDSYDFSISFSQSNYRWGDNYVDKRYRYQSDLIRLNRPIRIFWIIPNRFFEFQAYWNSKNGRASDQFLVWCGYGGVRHFVPGDDDDDGDNDYDYFVWIDYVSKNLSILFGLWGSRPQGCTAFGVKLDQKDNSIVEEYYGDFSQYADFGFHLVKSKNGVVSDHDFSNFPIRHDEEGYLENYFLASWINPQCIFSPGGASRHSIGNSFDWLWHILPF